MSVLKILRPIIFAIIYCTIVNSFTLETDKSKQKGINNHSNTETSESKEKSNPLYHVEEKNIARAWGGSDKNAPLYCKRACKRALDLSCADFHEQCTSDFKKTLLEDCKTECRYEFDSTFNYNSYVRPKPHKNGKKGNGKKENGKKENGKKENGKKENGKKENGKKENGNKQEEAKITTTKTGAPHTPPPGAATTAAGAATTAAGAETTAAGAETTAAGAETTAAGAETTAADAETTPTTPAAADPE